MTAIQQSLVTGHQSQNRAEGDAPHAGLQAINSSTGEAGSSTVNISWQAVMRLSAFEQQRIDEQSRGIESSDASVTKEVVKLENNAYSEQNQSEARLSRNGLLTDNPSIKIELDSVFPENIRGMLSEIEQNLVQTTEPGYKHLKNLLNSQNEALSEPGQLQEIVRKEKFFLGRRKAFMDSSEFQSYSQVLNQFSNIIQREFSM